LTIVILAEFAAPRRKPHAVFLWKNANTKEEFSTKKNRPGFWEVPALSGKNFYVISHLQDSI